MTIQPDERDILAKMSTAVSAFRLGDTRLPMSMLPLFLTLAKQWHPTSVGDLARLTRRAQSVISRQLDELGDVNGLVRREVIGSHTMVSLTPVGEALSHWLFSKNDVSPKNIRINQRPSIRSKCLQ
jgi:hypothetical protein